MDSWMFRIIRNAWIDEARSRGRRARVFAPEEDGLAVGADPSPNLEARADLSRAQAAMQRLPAEQREAIALVLVEGLGYADRKRVVEGKSVSVRVGPGGGRCVKNKKTRQNKR